MSEPLFNRIAVIGLGLIGGSFAAAARQNGLARSIVAGSRSARTLEQGIALGVVISICLLTASTCVRKRNAPRGRLRRPLVPT